MLKVANAILSARDASLVIGGRTILDRVNLDVRPNEIVTVIGPNGAGKSTLVRCLLGLQPLTSGEIIRSKGLRVGYVPQRFPQTLNVPLDVRRLLSLTLKPAEDEIDAALS
uniref:ATP-binding cassette domain-containing protein n=1 Tax=Aestuariivirga sp. TaxID=2650926 RepID=UPI00378326D9